MAFFSLRQWESHGKVGIKADNNNKQQKTIQNGVPQKREVTKIRKMQGDQIGRIFTYWMIYFNQFSVFVKLQK
jgi:hypothetical protein